MNTYLVHLRQVFERFQDAELNLKKKKKCDFCKAHLRYKGHLLSGRWNEPLPEKLHTIRTQTVTSHSQRSLTGLGINTLLK